MHLVGAFGCRHLDGERASVGLDALVGMCGCVDLDGILVSEKHRLRSLGEFSVRAFWHDRTTVPMYNPSHFT